MDIAWGQVLASVLVGLALAGCVHAIWLSYDLYARGRRLQGAERRGADVECVEGIVIAMECTDDDYTWSARTPYLISYKFETGSGSTIQVLRRGINQQAYSQYEVGSRVNVLYLSGHPKSCRLEEMVEEDALFRRACFISCCNILLAVALAYAAVVVSARVLWRSKNSEVTSNDVLQFVIFLICLCGGSVWACKEHVRRKTADDSMYGGEVYEDGDSEISGSESSEMMRDG